MLCFGALVLSSRVKVLAVMMEGSSISPGTKNLADLLGFTPGFTSYLSGLVSGMQLESKYIKEAGNPGSKVTVTLTFCATGNHDHDKFSRERQTRNHKGKPRNQPVSNTTTTKKKKKTPSRRRRDRERFLKFLERKKQRKAQKEQLSQSSISSLPVSQCAPQCAPPVEAVATVPDPPTVTRHRSLSVGHWESRYRSLSASGHKEVEDIRTSPPAENFHGPFLQQCYNDCVCPACVSEPSSENMAAVFCDMRNCCYWCGAPPNQVVDGLKKCTKCKCVAYCSKGCQIADWNQRHKVDCKMNLEAAHKAVGLIWNVRTRHRSHIHRLASYRSRIGENALLISPYIGIVSVI